MTQSSALTDDMRPVEPDAIETALDTAWREENASVLASGGHAGSRSSVLTLVAYTTDEAGATRTRRAIQALTTQHPSRSIIVSPTAQNPSGKPLEAYIGTRAMIEVDRAELIRLMVGREIKAIFPKIDVPIGPETSCGNVCMR